MRASKSPNGIPFQYFYPITITLLVLSVIGAFIDPDSNIKSDNLQNIDHCLINFKN